jgi:hypothetical protein
MRAFRTGAMSLLVVSIVMGGAPAMAVDGPIWRRTPGGAAALTVTPSRRIYVVGSIRGKRGDALMVAKYGPQGRLIWRRTWRHAGPLWHAAGGAVAPAPGGGVFVGGDTGHGTGEGGDALLLRYSATGRLRWRRELPEEFGTSMVSGLAATSYGVVATVEDFGCCDSAVERDGYVQAFRADGARVWRSAFEAPGIDPDTRDAPEAVATSWADRVYVVGSIDRRVYREGAPPPDVDRMIQALDRHGRVVWTRVNGRDGHRTYDDRLGDVAVRRGLVVVAGSSWSRSGHRTVAWLAAIGPDGQRRWADAWDGAGHQAHATAAAIAPWGPIYVGTDRSLRRYTRAGGLREERPTPDDAWVTDVAARGAVYLTAGRELQRWRR